MTEQSKWARLPEPIRAEQWVAEQAVPAVPGSVTEAPATEQIERDQFLRWCAAGG